MRWQACDTSMEDEYKHFQGPFGTKKRLRFSPKARENRCWINIISRQFANKFELFMNDTFLVVFKFKRARAYIAC